MTYVICSGLTKRYMSPHNNDFVSEFLGFNCPAPPLDAAGQPLDIVQNYK